jgi:hypothetical protein
MIFNSNVNLRATSPYIEVLKYVPVVEAKECTPDWFKNLKGVQRVPVIDIYNNQATPTGELSPMFASAKFCPAINDILSTGFIIKMWCDAEIRVYPDGNTQHAFSSNFFKAESHSPLQYDGIIKNFTNIKLISPWHFVTNKKVDFYWTSPFYHTPVFEQNNIIVMPGLLNFYYNHVTNINLLLPVKSEEYTVQLKAGQPLVHLIPMTKDKINLAIDQISFDDFSTSTMNLKFYGTTSFKNKNLSKCPFAFLHKKK